MGYRGLLLLACFFAGAASAATPTTAPVRSEKQLTSTQVATLAIPFVPNDGQVDARVAFYAPLFTGTVFVTRDGEIVYSLPAQTGSHTQTGWALTERLATSSKIKPKGGDAASARANYFIGRDPANWQHDLPTYGSVSLGQPWPGIEVSLTAHADHVETFYAVAAGADVKRIRLKVSGAKTLNIKDGQLLADTGLGKVAFETPRAWQEIGGARRPVEVRYTLHGRHYGFTLGSHDRSAPVVIDPDFQATYLGGSNAGDSARIFCMAVSASGDVYVAGETSSTDFPGTTGGAEVSYPGKTLETSFVAKLDAGLTTLEQASFLGGTNLTKEDEYALAIAIDSSGDVYVAGRTSSTNFPGTSGGAQASLVGGDENGYIAKLSPDLKTLEQATYLGGGAGDSIQSIALDASGDVYVAGVATAGFPGVSGGYQASITGLNAAFVAKLNPGLTALDQATYLGGSGSDSAAALAIDPAGDVYVAGSAGSTDFPGTAGGAQTTNAGVSNGNVNGFIAELSPDLTTLDQATYIGGSGSCFNGDEVISMALGSTGDVYVSGRTCSTDFPATSGGAQSAAASGSSSNGFVAKLDASLTSIEQATYLGGTNAGPLDDAYALALDSAGDVYVTGMTSSSNFPGTAGGAYGVVGEGYVAKLNSGLTAIDQATYLGGSSSETIALSPTGDVYATGYVFMDSLPGTAGGAQPSEGAAGSLSYIVKFPADLKAQASLKLEFPSGLPAGNNATSLLPGDSDDISVTVMDESTDTDATGIVYTVTLPSNLSLQFTSPEFGTCAAVGQVITCHATGLSLTPGLGFTNQIGVKATAAGSANVTAAITQVDQDLTTDSITSAQLPVVVVSTDTTANAGSVNTNVDQAANGTLSASNPCACGTPVFKVDTAPAHGNVTFTNSATGAFNYKPAAGYVGSDSFTFELGNGVGSATPNTEQVTITDPAPTASGATLSTKPDTAVGGALSATRGYTGQSLTFSVVSQPAHGSVTLNAGTGKFTYTPATGFAGADGFTFQVTDAIGTPSNVAAVAVTVNDIVPKANAVAIRVTPKKIFSGTLKAATAYSGQTLTFKMVSGPRHGTVTITDPSTGSYTFTAAAGSRGGDSFTFQAVDQWGTTSNTATISVLIL